MASEFPRPSCMGKHQVGCIDLMHKDLLVRIFYPSVESATDLPKRYTKWLPSIVYAEGYVDMIKALLPSWKTPPFDVLLSPVIRATYGAPLKKSSGGYPVAVLSHGLGGNRCMYSATAIGLASHGYVVASVEHRDASASTSLRRVPGPGAEQGQFKKYVNDWIPFNTNCGIGRFEKNVTLRRQQVKIRRKDVSAALDLLSTLDNGRDVDNMTVESYDYGQFAGQLDTGLCFAIGHSFGGGTVIQTLHEDKRFRCGIALDPNLIPVHEEVYSKGLDQPLLFINSELDYQWKENVDNIARLTKPVDKEGVPTTPLITLRGTTHGSFSDPAHCLGLSADIETSHKLVIELTCAFANRYLRKDFTFSPNLDGGKHQMSNKIIYGVNLKSLL